MAASNIVLFDALATPVSHTFVPLGPDADKVFWFEDSSALAAIGNNRISFQLKRPALPVAGQSSLQRTYRAVFGLHLPVLETLGTASSGLQAVPQVSYTPKCFVEFLMSERSTLVERKTLRKMIANLAAEAQFIALVETLVTPY